MPKPWYCAAEPAAPSWTMLKVALVAPPRPNVSAAENAATLPGMVDVEVIVRLLVPPVNWRASACMPAPEVPPAMVPTLVTARSDPTMPMPPRPTVPGGTPITAVPLAPPLPPVILPVLAMTRLEPLMPTPPAPPLPTPPRPETPFPPSPPPMACELVNDAPLVDVNRRPMPPLPPFPPAPPSSGVPPLPPEPAVTLPAVVPRLPEPVTTTP